MTMIELANAQVCSGCSACRAACPKHAIAMKADGHGFLHPVIDASLCVQCGACARACPVLHPAEPADVRGVFSAKSVADSARAKSSSGGVFPLLARATLAEGGVVFGARWTKELAVVHDVAENDDRLRGFFSSKYLQSDLGDAFTHCRDELARGRQVLFSGTPCQIAGLRRFLGRDFDNLLAVQVICHSAPSPLAWRKYLESCARKLGAPVTSAECRDKTHGWKLYEYVLGDGAQRGNWIENPYSTSFLTDLVTRSSCAACAARAFRSGADLTLGDFWFIWTFSPEMDDDRGTSLVLTHSERGQRALDAIRPSLVIKEESYANAVKFNPALEKDSPPNPRRDEFFTRLKAGEDYVELVRELVGEDPLNLRRFIPMLRKESSK